jgi:hypothetical protein
MVWNHRVVRKTYGDDPINVYYEIHEAYYPEPGARADMTTLEACAPIGETLSALRRELEMMLRACDHPVLSPDEPFDDVDPAVIAADEARMAGAPDVVRQAAEHTDA